MPGTDDAAVRELVAQTLDEDRAALVADWVRQQLDDPGASEGERDLRREATELVEALRAALGRTVPIGRIVEQDPAVRDALTSLSERRARAGAEPSATAMAILALKRTMLGAIERHTADSALRYRAALLVNELLDSAGVLSFAVYSTGRERIIREQNSQMLELSTPVVQLWRHVLAVPLIGTLDSARTQVVMTSLLEAIQANQARVAIIDITGVPTVDTAVAQHLLQTVSAVRLMGAECVISGIRPSIAQTITQLGIDLSHILTRGSLADALATALQMLEHGSRPGAVTG
ncbi:STAS domain-containing protein [Amycolatopsis australiensis]|uniref:RsbT co-antagonist protein RsbR n=1 Tax=Amycolatopsis australiensis TaxID=546364 RepID=A0A1K1R7J5_9PSEU|nr:STAS domain-containing protein [Amycolatopsis australiensis]SFW67606.1 rsbT co-antagonist protein RsbR [Amycolatopsis australiensis]